MNIADWSFFYRSLKRKNCLNLSEVKIKKLDKKNKTMKFLFVVMHQDAWHCGTGLEEAAASDWTS